MRRAWHRGRVGRPKSCRRHVAPRLRRHRRYKVRIARHIFDTSGFQHGEMTQLDIAGIDARRIEQVVTHRLVEVPTLPKLLAPPILGVVAGVLYAGLAPLWMFLVPA